MRLLEKKDSCIEGDETALVSQSFISDLAHLIESTRNKIVHTANSSLVMLYWHLGKRINEEILKDKRAGYGDKIIATVSQHLAEGYGKGFNKSALTRMINFFKSYPDLEIVATLSQQLSWSHIVELIPIIPPIKRDFYAEMCRISGWSVRQLRNKIDSMLYERTAISKKPENIIEKEIEILKKEGDITADLILKDPYLLDFLELEEPYDEKDLENAMLRELEKFILELGSDFSFIARQKRITIGDDDYYIDLLFYNRSLKRLIALELKLGKFKAADKGQMELYLRWLDKYERKGGENSPLGIILCSDKNNEQVELLELAKTGIHVAQYLTKLPDIKALEVKLHKAIEMAKRKYENVIGDKD